VGDALLVEDVGLGPELQRGAGQAEALRQPADGDEHRRGVRVLAAIDGRGRHLVVRQHLDDAIGAPLRVRDEDHGFAGLPRRAQLRDPVGTRPANSIAGCVAMWRTWSSVPSASVSIAVADAIVSERSSQDTTSDAGSGARPDLRAASA
jgi:hypothetical protein